MTTTKPRQRTPQQEANGIAAAQVNAFLEAGQPMWDCGCEDDPCVRCRAVKRALELLDTRLLSRSGTGLRRDP